jgi:hypothetical protein
MEEKKEHCFLYEEKMGGLIIIKRMNELIFIDLKISA